MKKLFLLIMFIMTTGYQPCWGMEQIGTEIDDEHQLDSKIRTLINNQEWKMLGYLITDKFDELTTVNHEILSDVLSKTAQNNQWEIFKLLMKSPAIESLSEETFYETFFIAAYVALKNKELALFDQIIKYILTSVSRQYQYPRFIFDILNSMVEIEEWNIVEYIIKNHLEKVIESGKRIFKDEIKYVNDPYLSEIFTPVIKKQPYNTNYILKVLIDVLAKIADSEKIFVKRITKRLLTDLLISTTSFDIFNYIFETKVSDAITNAELEKILDDALQKLIKTHPEAHDFITKLLDTTFVNKLTKGRIQYPLSSKSYRYQQTVFPQDRLLNILTIAAQNKESLKILFHILDTKRDKITPTIINDILKLRNTDDLAKKVLKAFLVMDPWDFKQLYKNWNLGKINLKDKLTEILEEE